MNRRHRNGDRDLRDLERAYLADPTDLTAYEALLAARLRAGIPVDDPRTPPSSVEAYALLLAARVRSGVITQDQLITAATLGSEPAILAAGLAEGLANRAWSVERKVERRHVAALGNAPRIVSFAADCVDHVMHIYTRSIIDNDSPQSAIAAVRAWVVAPSPETSREVDRASEIVGETTTNLTDNANNTPWGVAYVAGAACDVANSVAERTILNATLAIEGAVRAASDGADYMRQVTRDGSSPSGQRARLDEQLWQRQHLAQCLLGGAP